MANNNRNQEDKGASIKLGPKILDLLRKIGEIELENVEINAEEIEIWIPTLSPTILQQVPPSPEIVREKPMGILEAEFKPPIQAHSGKILEVKLGATKLEGGSRGKTVTIGGERSPAFYLFEEAQPNPPIVSVDVFDTEVSLPKSIRMHVQEVLGDPSAWAKLAVDKFNADAVTVHLVSTDPLIKNASARDAARTIEQVLQAVDVPIIVGGCGDPKKDAEVFQKVSEVAAKERVMLSSLTPDMAEAGILGDVCKAAKDNGHVVLAFTALDLNRAKELNRRLYEFLPKESIVMDLTTAALGYGLEYSFSIHERARLAALAGDTELQHPTLSGTTNAWAAREAWMKMGAEWEPRELRGPIWETVTALVLLLAGVDVFMMMHPAAIRTVKDVVKNLSSLSYARHMDADWISIRT
ncbi:CO dehydrogenase/acetyl-CoA synthase subunit delta [Candidatus Bathyarchaeota archaeon]|nr:CO dehydrogenase/acetyl-CoA synthase subunit delta [Candidatus Bathyarchaeota archaeon]